MSTSDGLTDRIVVLRPLKVRDFRLLWVGLTVSLIGDGMYAVAMAWQVYEDLDASPAAFAAVGAAWTIPQLLLLLVSGALSDRMMSHVGLGDVPTEVLLVDPDEGRVVSSCSSGGCGTSAPAVMTGERVQQAGEGYRILVATGRQPCEVTVRTVIGPVSCTPTTPPSKL